jgi:hypothetical protein
MDLTEMMAADASNAKKSLTAADEDLQAVGILANHQHWLETRLDLGIVSSISSLDPSIGELEAALKAKKEELTKIKEVSLPNALEKFGISELRLVDGSLVSVKEEVYAGITEDNKEPAFKWLRATGNDGIIKNDVNCAFGKGQDAEAKQLIDMLIVQGYSFTNKFSVHPSTLKAFVRKQLEAGSPIPTDVFSIHVKKVATVKAK